MGSYNCYKINQDHLTAIKLMLLNCFVVSSMGVFSRFSVEFFSTSILMLIYNLIAFTILSLYIFIKKLPIKTRNIYLYFFRSLVTVIAYFLFFRALKYISIANATALSYLDPVLSCLLISLVLHEKFSTFQIIRLAIAFLGMILIVKPDSNLINYGGILVVFATILWAIANTITRFTKNSDSFTIQVFYTTLFGSIILFILSFFEEQKFFLTNYSFGLVFTISFLALIQYFSVFKSLSLAPAVITMPFSFSAIVFSIIYSHYFFNESQSLLDLIGTILIIFANVIQFFIPKILKITT